ncbi:hypothetical protein QE374_002686 [Microbacterium sp. SORGH_AS428]|uniref:hypothetical protein n=1 Tax=Microbacterium sp. SORGH_AS_0428 TaxID=3041788 RepID=UPI0028624A9E|nr:hypothetical protein [Microbacterium sp. SORGH_AS_0428]MDR6200777.1 hypothetical protein [Microbacterium sp. SORGH_AS_0428]
MRILNRRSSSSGNEPADKRGSLREVLSFSIAAVVGVGAGLGATVAIAAGASATSIPAAPVQGNLVAQADVADAWTAAIENSELALPAGEAFPTTPPWIFSTDDAGDDTYYEDTMFDQVALQYWRCSWLKSELSGSASAEARSATSSRLSAALTESFEEQLPEVSSSEYSEYRRVIDDEAVSQGVSSSALEYADNCVLYTGEVK